MSGTIERDEIVARLNEHTVRAVYEALGVERFESGGPNDWKVSAPWRTDEHPSVTIRKVDGVWSDKESRGDDIFKAVMLTMSCSFPEALAFVAEIVGNPPVIVPNGRPQHPPVSRKIAATYSYFDEQGQLLYQSVRFEPKDFSRRRPDGKGGWINSLKGVRLVPYHLDEIVAADPNETILLLEGEKDADRARAFGFVATTTIGVSNGWKPEYAAFFRGKRVAIISDHDKPGRQYALAGARDLTPVAAEVRLVELPGLGPVTDDHGKDFSDWSDAGWTADNLRLLIETTPAWEPEREQMPGQPAGDQPDHLSPDPIRFPRTDTGNAERLVARHGRDIRYCWERKAWLVWNGTVWALDPGKVEQLAKATVRSIPQEVAGLHGDAYADMLRWAAASESAQRRKAMLELARSEEGVGIRIDQLDADPWLLNCRNGTVDLHTGALRPHRREDYLTKVVEVDYGPAAHCPIFDAFLATIFDGDAEVIEYVWRLIGYSLTGITSEQIIVFCWGGGENGKSTLINTLRDLLGPYAAQPDSSTFMEQRADKVREDLADLVGVRLAAVLESKNGRNLDTTLIKLVTGGERQRARRLYENGFEYTPVYKLWLASNHRPKVSDSTHAMWRRIKLVPFTVRISEAEKDTSLPDKLRAEFPGILARAIRACLAWQREGLGEPKAVRDATADYRRDENPIGEWLEERCDTDNGLRTLSGALYADYCAWCAADEPPISQTEFGSLLTEQGFREKRSNGKRYRTGLAQKGGGRSAPGDWGDQEEPEQEAVPGVPGVPSFPGKTLYRVTMQRFPQHPSHPAHPAHPALDEEWEDTVTGEVVREREFCRTCGHLLPTRAMRRAGIHDECRAGGGGR